ncbi:MAG: 3-hydroxyacyl-ACP dehydratase FabZ [Acidobacteriota bacterium]|nr:3-hydroxyacyl-ACP dehydratase FabZ [Acidobacteriota bacterium]
MSEPATKTTPDWDVEWVMSVLPHRYPFLLVDRVLEMEEGKRIVALKNVTINEPFFPGHFPGRPVMPGVLVIEGIAQAGGLLLLHNVADRRRKLVYLTSIQEAKFRCPVVPGDQLRYELEVLRLRSVHCRLAGRALVGGRVVAEAVISSTMVSRQVEPAELA